MNPLENHLISYIQENGDISVYKFQELCLYHPIFGYYAQSQVIGRKGDFITAPELTQVFGETCALWFVQQWYQLNEPNRVLFVELGPGRGTLMQDMLRTFKAFPDFFKTLNVVMVETSSYLKELQMQTLANLYPIKWVSSLFDVEEGETTFIIANEFFDALPVEQFVCFEDSQKERKVSYNAHQGFYFVKTFEEKNIYETSSQSLILAQEIKRRFSTGQGVGLIIDYGDYTQEPRFGDTLQALYQHQRVSPLSLLGHCDLSHHVDFKSLENVFGSRNCQISSQAQFLQENGFCERTSLLAQKFPQDKALLELAATRLLSSTQMGYLFKALKIVYPFDK